MKRCAFLMRYGHQQASEVMSTGVRRLTLLVEALAEIIDEEHTHLTGGSSG
jgi:hypothetical protein